jgi:hypothetical protein
MNSCHNNASLISKKVGADDKIHKIGSAISFAVIVRSHDQQGNQNLKVQMLQ